ncbi:MULTISPECIES: bifunctional diguanylate cyclase/phosphodiesterase [unclassified Wenzhouxiangella]|uniref:putative bifunctional diguanylate cyclase/phosphodiesterase n=1 Tax=unclassified Wenzhouxiangella TaxID=2613841 RepID=UPI000E328958|nr:MULTISPECIES: EAL domain-containing protein [unclassified Wenzhouxiangella]RFF28182.1 EAL domain-containing protein [Wenzhouxiangella sp. 15181]RFP67951.1 EAL domain-containing protein [Wenzhouxiangella sp. 15190]
MRAGLSLLVALAVFLGGQLLLARTIHGEQQRDAELQRFLALQELAASRARLEGRLGANLISVRTLRAEIALNPDLETRRFERLVSELLTAELHTRHIAAAPDLVVRYVYPREGNEAALGFDYRTNPEQYQSIRAAIEAGEIVINGPVDLVQGGRALIGRVPVYRRDDGAFWGVISVVIDHERLFKDAGLTTSSDWQIGLRGRDGEGLAGEVILGDPALWLEEPVTVPVELPVGRWVLAAVPAEGDWESPLFSYRWQWLLGSALNAALGLLIFGLLASRSRLKGALSTISHQARFDSLTELPNRQYFMHQLSEAISRARREQGRFALLFIDLDHFKEINDSLGHEAGDELLQLVSERIRATLRGHDLVGRFGGDEFVVLLHDLSDPVDAEIVAGKLLHVLHPVLSIQGHDVTIDGSIGIAVYPEDGHSAGNLLKHADLAMYAAKSAGRGTSHFFNDSLRQQAESHLRLHNQIKQGLAQDQFQVYYQPIVEAASRRLVCVEALVRWQHPQRGLVGPGDFIPVAERTGVIRDLGNFVLRRACRDLVSMQRVGLDIRLALNRSAREFNDRQTVMRWLEVIDKTGVARERLTFEITESVLMPDQIRQHRLLRRLNAEGVSLAIDDFGQGYSSITYLRKFPVSQIKIDRVFVQGMNESPEQLALVEAMVKMAQALHLQVVAEGVETAEQADRLTGLGCQLLQGYLFGRPMTLQDLLERFGASAGLRQ